MQDNLLEQLGLVFGHFEFHSITLNGNAHQENKCVGLVGSFPQQRGGDKKSAEMISGMDKDFPKYVLLSLALFFIIFYGAMYLGARTVPEGTDLLEFTVDRNPFKQGRFTPGTHIPIHPPEKLREEKPDYVLILPWNLEAEIVGQHAYIRDWGARFLVPIPEVREVIP